MIALITNAEYFDIKSRWAKMKENQTKQWMVNQQNLETK